MIDMFKEKFWNNSFIEIEFIYHVIPHAWNKQFSGF